MSFKIADAYVAVTADESGLAADLRAKIIAALSEATDGIEAKIGLGLTDDAPEDLLADLDSAILLAAEGKDVHVGMGLSGDSVEELDADVKAALLLVEEDAKVKVSIDAKSSADTGEGLSKMLIGAFALASAVGPAALLMGTAAALVGVGALVDKSNAQLGADYTELATTAKASIQEAVSPLTTDLEASVGILQQGVSSLQPQLKSLFADVAPDAEAVTSGMVQFADDALPGIKAGMQDIAPYMSSFAHDAGVIGSGLGGFFSGIGSGAAGGSAGLSALSSVAGQLLQDVGQLVGELSRGLGPALQDIDDVAGPTARLLTDFVGAIPPGVIETAADAVALLFAAFKIGSLVGVIDEGQTFLQFVRGVGSESGEAEGAVGGLSSTIGSTVLPIGLAIAAAGMLGEELGKLSGVGVNGGSVPQLTSNLLDAGAGSQAAQQNIDALAASMAILGQVSQTQAAAGLANVDESLAQLTGSDPKAAAAQFDSITAAMKANGATAAQIAADFPQYTAALQDAANAAKENGAAQAAALTPAQQFAAAVKTARTELDTQNQSLLVNATALNNSLPPQDHLTSSAIQGSAAYQQASSAATEYSNSLTALYGKFGDTTMAAAAFTTDLSGLTGQITAGTHATDVNSAAGAKNMTAFGQAAQAAENYAQQLIKQGDSSGQAQAALQQMVTRLDATAKQSGLTTDQIYDLNEQLFGVKSPSEIVVKADTSQAMAALAQLIGEKAAAAGAITIGASIQGHAAGGFAPAGEMAVVGEKGPEIVVFGSNATVIPNSQIRTVGSPSGGSGGGYSASAGMTIQNLSITIPMQGFADFTNPNAMSVSARQQAIRIKNVLEQLEVSTAGARR